MRAQTRNVFHRIFSAGAALAAAVVLLSCNPPNYPTKPIELKYYANGPWTVTVSTAWNCCDSAGNKFDLYYPPILLPPPPGFPILTPPKTTNSPSTHPSYFLNNTPSYH